MRNKCSPDPQDVIPNVIWYYESPGRIHIVVSRAWAEKVGINGSIFTIPRKKLEASLKRMNASRKRKPIGEVRRAKA